MKSYFLTKYKKFNEPTVNETKQHLPYVPTYKMVDESKLSKTKKK